MAENYRTNPTKSTGYSNMKKSGKSYINDMKKYANDEAEVKQITYVQSHRGQKVK